MSSHADGSEDVSEFLKEIKGLGERRDEEDELRNKKLEEEILQGRKERQARRAERARSISPTKSSPANTPTASKISATKPSNLSETLSPAIDLPEGRENRRDAALGGALDRLTGRSASPNGSPTKEKGSPFEGESGSVDSGTNRIYSAKASPSSAMPPRNSPLSWQRRPNSQASDRPRTRPLSMVATENAARSPRATPEPSPVSSAEIPFSREQIAQSLASKDPAWFRQTADRGANSPAYRRNQVEDEDRSDHGSSSARVQMPGMSREIAKETAFTDTPDRSASSSPSRSSAGVQQSVSRSSGFGSPVPLTSAQRFEPPNIDSMSEARGLAMSPSQGRISPERLDRPPSPTKGMGGFVQSAMMKRSDSVSKRWSVQSPPGLNRGNSIASNRSTHDSSAPLGSVGDATGGSRPNSMSRDNSPRPSSRPTSSHSNATVTQDGRPGTSSSMRSSMITSTDKEGFVKPGLPASHSQTPKNSISGEEDTPNQKPAPAETTPPSSPSKTMDSRRWSPTKASWLESALNKPDSPKPKAAPPQQPSWMADINKAKTRGSVDLGRSPTSAPKHDVSIGGLMRSPPPGSVGQTKAIGGFPPIGASSGTTPRSRPEGESSLAGKISHSGKEAPPIKSPKPSTAATFPPSNGTAKFESSLKNDFRANLKPRQLPIGGEKEEPEFKNMFGQLRRTKTQNYVAPDELKSNITRGKAALNTTGGPKKTERVDEFKDAILKKKEDFKKAQLEGKGVTKGQPAPSQVSEIPEALAKRRNLGKMDSSSTQVKSTSIDSPSSIQELSKHTPPKNSNTLPLTQAKDSLGSKLAGRLNPALSGLLARGPPSMGSETSRSSSPSVSQRTVSTSTSTTVESSEPGPQLTHMTKARARGPRRKAPSGIPRSVTTTTDSAPDTKALAELPTPLPEPSETQTSRTQSTVRKLSTPSPITTDSSKTFKLSSSIPSTPKPDTENIASPQPSSPNKLDLKRRSQFLQDSPNKSNKGEQKLETPKPLSSTSKANSAEISIKSEDSKLEPIDIPVTKPRPETPTKSPSLKSRSPITERHAHPSGTTKLKPSPLSPKKLASNIPAQLSISNIPAQLSIPSSTTSEKAALESPDILRSAPVSPKKTSIVDLVAAEDSRKSASDNRNVQLGNPKTQAPGSSPSVRNTAALWDRPTANEASQPPRARSPIKLPTHDDEKAAMVGAGLRSLSPGKTGELPKRDAPSARQLSLPPLKSPVKANSPVLSQSAEASKLVTDFFESHEPHADYVTDTAELLSLRPDRFSNIQTLESSLYEFSGNGKKQLVPNHQERLLFEGSMYICVHNFKDSTQRKVKEVYFWIGDEVPIATAEDANIYARREARGSGGTLIKIQQGKETSEFIQALGGIIIIRRGTSNKYDSLSPHMLCARKYLSQIVFDEVDYSLTSLCSGFPYLISTQSGKCFLWKGKGSGVEELGCARLIGMDFGVMGDIEEIEEGQEPPSFLQVFSNGTNIPPSANHWKMKPNYDKYCGRLFCANSTAKSQIVEVAPFCQSDVSPYNIYILDAFFELYIIVGSKAQSQYAAFENALTFAQEYSILAAGMEDRPHVPITTVVLEGIPRDMKSVFRKWRDGLTPTIVTPTSPGIRRGRSLRVVPLNAALEATRLG